jgi:uncharacterized sporulation protein YeaH/YhbH (DUF444 family)
VTDSERRAAIEQAAEKMQALAAQIKVTEDSSTILALTKDLRETAKELRNIVRKVPNRRGEPSLSA